MLICSAADTPGVHLHHRIPHMLTPEEVRLLHPRRPLRPFIPPSPKQILAEAAGEGEDSGSDGPSTSGRDTMPMGSSSGSSRRGSGKEPVSATYFWSGLARVDVVRGPPSTALVFYGPSSLRAYGLPLLRGDEQVELSWGDDEESDDGSDDESPAAAGPAGDGGSSGGKGGKGRKGGASVVLDGSKSVAARGGLIAHELVIKAPLPTRDCLADVAISGVPGWVSVYAPFAREPVVLRVWAPRGVEVFLRPPLPVPNATLKLQEEEEVQELGEMLGGSEVDDMWGLYKDGLDLKGLGLEGEEEAVKMLLFGGGKGGPGLEEALMQQGGVGGWGGYEDAEDEGWEVVEEEGDEDEEHVVPEEFLERYVQGVQVSSRAGGCSARGSSSSKQTSSARGSTRRNNGGTFTKEDEEGPSSTRSSREGGGTAAASLSNGDVDVRGPEDDGEDLQGSTARQRSAGRGGGAWFQAAGPGRGSGRGGRGRGDSRGKRAVRS